MQVLDQLAVDDDHAFARGPGRIVGLDDAARPRDFGRGRPERSVGGCDLLGMDQRPALEAEVAAWQAGLGKARFVGEIEVDAVQDRDPRGAGGQQAGPQRDQHRQPAGRVVRLEVLGEIGGAHDQAYHPLGVGDLLDMQDAARGLDHAPDRQLGRGTGQVQHVQRPPHRVRTLDLGQQDGVGPGAGHRGQVGVAPGRIQPVDPDDQLAPGIGVPVFQRRDDALPPLPLGVGRHRVLQVEDQPIGRKLTALFHGTRIRPGM